MSPYDRNDVKTAQTTGTSQITANVIRKTCSSTREGRRALRRRFGGRGRGRRGHPRFSPNAFTTKIEIGMIEIVSRITAIADP